MGRKSLSARAVACLLPANDDEVERKARRRSMFAPRRPTTSGLHQEAGGLQQQQQQQQQQQEEDEKQQQQQEEEKEDSVSSHTSVGNRAENGQSRPKASNVHYDFGSVLSLCSANKVNVNNTWNLDLIDHIDDVLELQKGSFQKASCTLQASVQIYEKRVDSTHQDTFKMLENVNMTRIGKVDDAEESREGRRKVARASRSTSTFLEQNLSAITHERVEKEFEVDPLFRKMSKTFDAGGARGLLLYHLGVTSGPVVVFDTNEARAFEDQERAASGESSCVERSASSASTAPVDWLEPAPAPQNDGSGCPSLELLHRMMRTSVASSENAHGTAHQENSSSTDVAERAEDLPSMPINYEDDADGFGDEADAFVFEADAGYDEFDSDSDQGDSSADVSGGHARPPSGSATPDLAHASSYRYFEPSNDVGQAGTSWAGPTHWKFGQGKRGKPTNADRNTSRKKPVFLLDLVSIAVAAHCEGDDHRGGAAEEARCAALAPPARPATINLAQRTQQVSKAPDLPEDLHYSVRDLCKLFLKSLMISEALGGGKSACKGRESSASLRSGIASEWGSECGPDGPDPAADAGFFDDFDGGPGDGQADDDDDEAYVAPSHTVEKISVDYARRAKKVDVAGLKRTLLNELLEHHHQPSSDGTSFVESVAAAAPKVDDQNVTVPFYFICLLHLANENDLELEGRSDLSDLIIRSC